MDKVIIVGDFNIHVGVDKDSLGSNLIHIKQAIFT